jgi:hypothetical protein
VQRTNPASLKAPTVGRQPLLLAEWIVAIALSLSFLTLLLVRARHAGPLWRDECATVQLSQMPTATQVLQNFQRESFPPFFDLLVRSYTAVFGASDGAFRFFGFAVGLLLLMVVWFNARSLTKGLPLVSLSLLALNTSFLIWGTTMRGYGLGSVAVLFAFGMMARWLIDSRRGVMIATFLASLFCVHLLLYNSVLLAVFVAVAMVVAFLTGRARSAWLTLMIGAVCAVSVLPCLGPFHYESSSTVVLQGNVDFPWLWSQLLLAFGNPLRVMPIAWGIVGAALLGVGIWRLCRTSRRSPEWSLLLFGLLVPILSFLAYFGFLRIVSYRTREWYYLALIAVLAGAFDLVAAILSQLKVMRWMRIALALAALVILSIANWPKVLERQSNIDRLAHKLEAEAEADDLIICNPWYLGVSYNWYYHGKAPWITCPILSDHTVHRFDLLKEKMMTPGAIDDLLEQVKTTLQANHRVWVVGDLSFVQENRTPFTLPPAPTSEFKWSCDAYSDSWSEQLGAFLQEHAANGGYVPLTNQGPPINELETLNLVVAQGWRGYGR